MKKSKSHPSLPKPSSVLEVVRSEEEVFALLAELCSSEGYAHALATMCFSDSFVKIGPEMKPEDLMHLFTRSRLIRTELSTLIGLMVKSRPIDYRLAYSTINQQIGASRALLEELHQALSQPFIKRIREEISSGKFSEKSPFSSGESLREPFFYSGESAYTSQYRDFAVPKYEHDNKWLQANKGFTIQEAYEVVKAVCDYQNDRQVPLLEKMKGISPEEWTVLPNFTFSCKEISDFSGIEVGLIERVFDAFSLKEEDNNPTFNSIHDFNAVNATPLIALPEGKFILYQYYTLTESLYESPYYWMIADRSYRNEASDNRGLFTEDFAQRCFTKAFGDTHVWTQVILSQKKGAEIGEIDCLVIFGEYAIVVQAKSKKLTLKSRKGSDESIQDDFKAAVQDAYNQAEICAQAMISGDSKLRDKEGNEITVPKLRAVFPVCLIAEHYPALKAQVRDFLKYSSSDKLKAPLVTDVFALDAITEMLPSPHHILHYLNLRARFGEQIMASHEHTLLSFHIKRTLWLPNDVDMMHLEDDIAADLDVAMAVRRDGMPGLRTPEGILTKLQNTPIGHIIAQLEFSSDPEDIELGLMLLQMSEQTHDYLNDAIRKIAVMTLQDGGTHDVTLGSGTNPTGITVYTSVLSDITNEIGSLRQHMARRKYGQKADTWFGIIIDPTSFAIRTRLVSEFPWKMNPIMENIIESSQPLQQITSRNSLLAKAKMGRNDPCPCGSGAKYKKCCSV